MTQAETELEEKSARQSVRELSARVARLEAHLGLAPVQSYSSSIHPASEVVARGAKQAPKDESGALELRIGEFGLAWVGSAVLFLGIVFLMVYTNSLGHRVLATAIGYAATMGLYSFARLWQQSIPHLSRVLVASSLLLLYYTTMRLGFFSASPLVENKYIVLSLLLAVAALQLAISAWRDWQWLAVIALTLWNVSALLINNTHVTLSLVASGAGLATYLAFKRDWSLLIPVSIILAYSAHLLWLMGNPVLSNRVQAVTDHQNNLVYLFLYATAFYLSTLFAKRASKDEQIISVLLNSIGFSMLVAIVAVAHYQTSYAAVYLCVAGFFLAMSIIQWLATGQQYSPAIYACFGYMALSVAIYGYARLPVAFLWLSLESLLVVSMALWLRSRTLVVMNSLIYVSILLAYFAISPSSHRVNFSFALVALASARVMNWQKKRLTLRTDLLRNVYLAIAFGLISYALYRAVPAEYVTLAWTATGVVYFAFSYLLHSAKYRLMAISAMMLSVIYLFLVDLAHLDPVFRVAAFLFLGLMALVISLFYTRARGLLKNKSE